MENEKRKKVRKLNKKLFSTFSVPSAFTSFILGSMNLGNPNSNEKFTQNIAIFIIGMIIILNFFILLFTNHAMKKCRVGQFCRAVVVAQLVERSLPIPDVRGSNPVIGKNLFIMNIYLLLTVNCVLKRRK